MSNPTRAEKYYWGRLANEVGCIACRLSGIRNHHVSIHHVDGRTKPGAHMKVLPLCFEHHQGGKAHTPSLHPWRRRFEAAFGTQEELMEKCNQILGEQDHGKQTDWRAA